MPSTHKKDKPWDHEGINHWEVVTIHKEDNPTGMLEESSFATLFPKYRGKVAESTHSSWEGAVEGGFSERRKKLCSREFCLVLCVFGGGGGGVILVSHPFYRDIPARRMASSYKST